MKRIVTFGEIMLRLKSPAHERLFQTPLLEVSFGGGEANVAASLAQFGMQASFVSALPANPVGEAAIRYLRSLGVDTTFVRHGSGRAGIYFLEAGSDMRPSQVIYDREGSAISGIDDGDFEWPVIFRNTDWFHLSGITPALSHSAADACLSAIFAARAAGARISIDLNYRKKLWNYGVTASEIMPQIVALADVLIANEEDIQLALGIGNSNISSSTGKLETDAYRQLAEQTRTAFPNLTAIAITMRESLSADRNGWSAILATRTGFLKSRHYELGDIVDRVGGGDAFTAGLIFGLLEYNNDARALDFAAAASALKHTIPGDINLVSREEVEHLIAGNSSGRVSR